MTGEAPERSRQEGLILAASVAGNIAYGRPDATLAEIRHAAEPAGAAAFIDLRLARTARS
jgi:ABC-type multidrug transport system fused ATPase/permease subunit